MSDSNTSDRGRPEIRVPVSPGELVDRASILSIKLERIHDPEKRAVILGKFQVLSAIMEQQGIRRDESPFLRLREVNLELWQLENAIREKENAREFDDEFIRIARSIYHRNDARAALKQSIDLEHGSEATEEKEYSAY